MHTALISDLHLGTLTDSDVLRRRPVREQLLEQIAGVDQLILLGDVLELREAPLADVLRSAGPFFDELGEAFAGKRVVMAAGNHDHHVVSGWLDSRALDGEGGLGLGLEQLADPSVSPVAAAIARRMPQVDLALAYPGLWVRDDVYATHGHYLDAHMTIPRIEAIAIAAVARMAGGFPDGPRTPRDYEGVLGPLYAFLHSLAQGRTARTLGTNVSRRVWARIDSPRGLWGRALGQVAIPVAVAALNRAGLGPFEKKVTRKALRRSGVEAMAGVVGALGVDADWVVFGHTHRPGPLTGDDDWQPAGGGPRLVNTGSWLLEPGLLSSKPGESPYWPGTAVFVDDSGPPEVRRLLQDMPQSDLTGRSVNRS